MHVCSSCASDVLVFVRVHVVGVADRGHAHPVPVGGPVGEVQEAARAGQDPAGVVHGESVHEGDARLPAPVGRRGARGARRHGRPDRHGCDAA